MARGGARGVLLVFSLLVATTSALLVRAALWPPPGTAFVGTFYYVDDFYNYLSYVQQAEDGALVFRNKLAPPAAPAALVNLEWLVVGWLSALLGHRPLLAYRLVGLVASLGLVVLADRWLLRCGLPRERRLAALLLVFTGGGLGGALVATGVLPPERALDLRAGLYPFVEVLANPHFVVGTTLLLAALGAYAAGRVALGALLATVLGLVRPYDAAIVALVAGAAVPCLSPPREWARRLAPVVLVAPVLAWNAWLFLASPGFSLFASSSYSTVAPGPLEIVLAVAPAAALSLLAMGEAAPDPEARRHRVFLALWSGTALALALAQPVAFATQFLVGVGLPLLALAAVGLSRRPRWLAVSVPLLAGSSVLVVALVARPAPRWHVPAERFRVAGSLRDVCRAGDLVLAPPDVGLYVGGLTSCWPWVSHAAAPDFEERDRIARRFYSAEPGEWRSRFLAETCVRAVVLPPADAAASASDPAPESGFRFLGDAPGRTGLAVAVRDRLPDSCRRHGRRRRSRRRPSRDRAPDRAAALARAIPTAVPVPARSLRERCGRPRLPTLHVRSR